MELEFLSEYWSYPIHNDGKIVGAVVTFLDVTDRKKAEEEIRTAARRREEFLAMLSHELRNPLSAVVSASRVMQSQTIKPEAITGRAKSYSGNRTIWRDCLTICWMFQGSRGAASSCARKT